MMTPNRSLIENLHPATCCGLGWDISSIAADRPELYALLLNFQQRILHFNRLVNELGYTCRGCPVDADHELSLVIQLAETSARLRYYQEYPHVYPEGEEYLREEWHQLQELLREIIG